MMRGAVPAAGPFARHSLTPSRPPRSAGLGQPPTPLPTRSTSSHSSLHSSFPPEVMRNGV